MDTLKISVPRIVTRLGQHLVARLHQRTYAAAQNRLLTEQIRLCLRTERGLKNARSCPADCQRVSQRRLQRPAGCILMNRHQTRNTFACLILASHGMSRSLGGDHRNIHILRRHDLIKMNIEAVSEHQHVALLQIRLNILLIHGSLQLVIDQNHDDIRFFCSFSSRIHLKALLLGALPGSASLVKTDDDVTSGLLCIQSMRVSLAAVADDCDGLSFQHGKITVFLIINFCHCFLLHCLNCVCFYKIVIHKPAVLIRNLHIKGAWTDP